MPRQARKESSTGFYHVIAKGINKENIFNQNREKIYLKRILRENIKEYNIKIYAYCIMSNHVHLIIKSEIQELSMFMAKCLAKYAEYYNYKRKRNGHVFHNRFKSECIETEKYFWNCLRYIHLNPLKANIVKSFLNYKFSSICEYQNMENDILHKDAISIFRDKFEDWEDFVNFHNKRQYSVFEDTHEDLVRQQVEIAIEYLFQMQREKKLEKAEEIIEDKELREEYIENIQKRMKISIRKSIELYKKIRETI